MTGTSEYTNKLEQTFGRLPGPVQSALRPAYQPVDDAIHWVCGDPDTLVTAGQTYHRLGGQVVAVSTAMDGDVRTLESSWSDQAGLAFRGRMTNTCKAMTAAGQSLQDTQQILDASAKAAVDSANTICDIVTSVVEFIIADFAVSAALAILSAGASIAAGIAAAIADWAEATFEVSRVVEVVAKVLREVALVLEKISTLLSYLRRLFKALKELKKDYKLFSVEGLTVRAAKTAISKGTSEVWNNVPGLPNMPHGGVHWGEQAGKDGSDVVHDVRTADGAG